MRIRSRVGRGTLVVVSLPADGHGARQSAGEILL
jgi:hypothetical protein